MLQQGFYSLEWESHRWVDLVQRLVRDGQLVEQPEGMGLISLLRKVQRRERLPKVILVLNLDRAMYDAFWLNGGEATPEEALNIVRRIVRSFGQMMAREREWFQRQSPIILLPVSSLQRKADGWWVGFKFTSGEVRMLFRVEWLIPNPALLEPKEILQGIMGCYSPF